MPLKILQFKKRIRNLFSGHRERCIEPLFEVGARFEDTRQQEVQQSPEFGQFVLNGKGKISDSSQFTGFNQFWMRKKQDPRYFNNMLINFLVLRAYFACIFCMCILLQWRRLTKPKIIIFMIQINGSADKKILTEKKLRKVCWNYSCSQKRIGSYFRQNKTYNFIFFAWIYTVNLQSPTGRTVWLASVFPAS